MMNAAFAELGLDWRYQALPVPPERFEETVRALPGSGYRAANVTSLAAVRQLFSGDWTLLAGWVHYLAFDLFVGAWIAAETERAGLSTLVLIPVLPLTFLFGPAGFLLFLILRQILAGAAERKTS